MIIFKGAHTIGVDVMQKETIFKDSKDSPQSTKGSI